MKKVIALFLCLFIMCTNFYICTYGEETTSSEYKTVYVNVAHNKPVTSSSDFTVESYSYPMFSLDKMVDGRITTCTLGTIPENGWIQVDLQRKYLIKELVITDRHDSDHAPMRTNIEILASNTEDFFDCDTLDYIGNTEESKFLHQEKWRISLTDNENYYRYIRIKRNSSAYGGIGELQVYAEQTVSKIALSADGASRETVSDGYTYGANRAIDGLNSNSAQAWVADGSDIYHYIRFSVPENKHIGYIEMEDRYNNNNTTTRQADLFYGSDSYTDHENAISLSTFESCGEYTLLGSLGHYGNYPETETFPFPAYPGGMYTATFNDEAAYKYFTVKKDYPLSATIGEFRAYEVNPQIISAYLDKNTKNLTISFTDEMDFTTVKENTFVLSNENEHITLSGIEKDSYTYILDASTLQSESEYTLTVSKDIKNKKAAGLACDFVKEGVSLKPYSAGKIEISNADNPNEELNLYNCENIKLSVNVRNNNTYDKDLSLIYAQYNYADTLKTVYVKTQTVKSDSSADITATYSLSFEEDDYIRAYLWDSDLKPISVSDILSAPIKNIYVSKSGNDENSGTKNAPVATLQRAKEIVSSINSQMENDINVIIDSGVYIQAETLSFTDADSGKNGFSVNYMGSGNTVISGGKQVMGWKSLGNNLYSASLEAESVRELYAEGKKAIRAQSENRIKPISIYEENEVHRGFVVSKNDIGEYKNPQDIQLHYTRSWRSVVLNVTDIKTDGDNRIIICKQPEFEYITTPLGKGSSLWIDETNGFYIENAYELLDSENEFYYDKCAKILYYKSSTFDVNSSEVYVPVIEKLITVSGSNLNNKAENISFSNLTFAHCAYNKVNDGFLSGQAQSYTILDAQRSAYPLDNTIVGANIRISAANNISFRNNIFKDMGAVSLGLYDGANNCEISGNAFYDINDSAITVGLPSDAYMQDISESENEVALFKPVTASGETRSYPACYANDGMDNTGWDRVIPEGGTGKDAYWQVDLEKKYTISKIKISPRKNYDQAVTRRNFEVLGSNDPTFAEGTYKQLAVQGSTAFSNETGFEADVTEKEKFRYIRIRKTVDEYFFISDVEVYTSDEEFIPKKEVCKNNLIKNNYITRIGQYNKGAPGIQTYYTDSLEISHNTIKDVPYTGIAVGWGWTNTTDSTTSKNNKILNNFIDTYNTLCFDGGGIYTLGQQPGSVISGNYIKNQINGHAGFYPDSGSSEFEFSGNIIENSDIPFFLYGPQSNLTLKGNYANSNNTAYNNKGTECTVETQQFFIPGSEAAEVLAIKNNSGLQEAYTYLLAVPYTKEAVTTDIEYNFGNAIDENKWNIGALQDPKFLEFYLEYLIEYANDLYNTGSYSDKIQNAKYRNLYSAIYKAQNAYTTAKNEITYATYDSTTGIYAVDEGMTMDRTAVIEARLALKAAISTFLAN